MKIFKYCLALTVWWLCSVPLNLFIFFVFLRQIMEGKSQAQYSPPAESDDQRIIALVEKNLSGYRNISANEGFGTLYERRMVDQLLVRTCHKYGLKSVLESPADGITGVPGANSLCLADLVDKPVALTNPSNLLLARAGETWSQMDLGTNVETRQCPVAKLEYPDNSYDLAWSFCMLEQMKDPGPYLSELFRVSAKLVMMITVNDNLGLWLHRLWHKGKAINWDHGDISLMRPEGVKKAFESAGLEVIETGGVDAPPTLDTSDMSLTEDLRRIAGLFGKKWDWNLEQEREKPGIISDLFCWVENNLPMGFKIRHAHHIYVVGIKKVVPANE